MIENRKPIPVGIQEIAERLGVQPDTVHKWRTRGVFTVEPRWRVSGAPAWDWWEVEVWAQESGRIRAA